MDKQKQILPTEQSRPAGHRDRESNNVSSNAGAMLANNVHKGTPYTKSPITMLSVALVR